MIVIAFAAAAIIASAVAVLLVLVVFSVLGEDRHGQLPHQAPGPIARQRPQAHRPARLPAGPGPLTDNPSPCRKKPAALIPTPR